ncbi:MAG: pterin-4-alpha-carbinolamine dehydratase [Halochromatium sp.]|uniref:pterin-4-alpha-carbinolamine dehydratase n=1 Tax=Halochromatium sp. TaxID=2049430 RepID=UPI00397E29FD
MAASTPESGAHPWRERARPRRLERRVVFDDYESLRDFLDQVAALSETTEIFPNLSFGRTYVNLTLFAEEGTEQVGEALHAFARQVDAFLEDADRADDA